MPSGKVYVCLTVDLLGLPIPAPSIPLRLHSLADTGSDGVQGVRWGNFIPQACKNLGIISPEFPQLALKKDATATRLLEEQLKDMKNKLEEKTKMLEEVSKKLEEVTKKLKEKGTIHERTKKPSLQTCRLWPTTLLKT